MLKPKYATGDRVVAAITSPRGNVRPGIYTIVRPLPASGQGYQYRAKNALDGFERVLDEDVLRPASA